jgi:hypothetical protein
MQTLVPRALMLMIGTLPSTAVKRFPVLSCRSKRFNMKDFVHMFAPASRA